MLVGIFFPLNFKHVIIIVHAMYHLTTSGLKIDSKHKHSQLEHS
jgi:hypothetical protein